MEEVYLQLPTALVPDYTCDVNCPIPLYEGRGFLEGPNGDISVDCRIAYTWRPSGGPEATLSPTIFSPDFFKLVRNDEKYFLRVPAIGLRVSVSKRRFTHGDNGTVLTVIIEKEVRMGNPINLTRVVFHIANFPHVLGETITTITQAWLSGRINLKDQLWAIEIDPIEKYGEQKTFSQQLQDERGYGITHVGSLVRLDGKPFTAEDADKVLTDIGFTLGFARAALSFPILRSGYDSSGTKVWQCWSGFAADAWQPRSTWFSSQQPKILQSLFLGFRQLIGNPHEEVIIAALGLYIDAHTATLTDESRLVIIQAALEGLASGWTFQPLPGAPALTGFKTGEASERIAHIAISLGLSLVVPQELTELIALEHPDKNSPPLTKMTWVRNSIAHLGRYPQLAKHTWEVRHEAYMLAAWHLELSLLRLLGADGLYQNRLIARRSGDVLQLPWVVQPAATSQIGSV